MSPIFSMVANLEAFSSKPTDGSVAKLFVQTIALPII